ncbi:UNVERIFIED_CONTAM: hypothetical protein Sangu_0747200 [Sesamum angustifolium]|uniref:Uncharacterized protein n=1 Tax=Sesamum angustifolium TaxID=2727405 RepID=A0AAW2PSN3_9LAMI
MTSLNNLADSGDNRRDVCRCLMDLIAAYNHHATAIATLPGFCGHRPVRGDERKVNLKATVEQAVA